MYLKYNTSLQENSKLWICSIKLAFLLRNTNMNPFSTITSRFSEILCQRSKNQQNRLFICCVYAEVNQQFQCFVYVKCFSRNTFRPYIQLQVLDAFLPKKKASMEIYYQVKGLYNTSVHFLTFCQDIGKWVNFSDRFFPAEHEYQNHFSYHV